MRSGLQVIDTDLLCGNNRISAAMKNAAEYRTFQGLWRCSRDVVSALWLFIVLRAQQCRHNMRTEHRQMICMCKAYPALIHYR
jgi:hypothetical protein